MQDGMGTGARKSMENAVEALGPFKGSHMMVSTAQPQAQHSQTAHCNYEKAVCMKVAGHNNIHDPTEQPARK
jgi:hypothetical protein